MLLLLYSYKNIVYFYINLLKRKSVCQQKNLSRCRLIKLVITKLHSNLVFIDVLPFAIETKDKEAI